jgi:2-dehydropantoate 2-reductase
VQDDARVLVAGVGAIGGWLLARLTEHGADVTGWVRGATAEQLGAGAPFTVEGPDGDWTGPVSVTTSPSGGWDLIVVAVKSQHTSAVAAQLPPARLMSAQNGVENPELLRRTHPDVEAAVVYCGAERLGPIHVRTEFPGAHLVLEDADLAAWLERHGIATKVIDDVRVAAWRKLLGNVAGNSLTAIGRARFGAVFEHPEVREVARAAIAETAAVARAEGIPIDTSDTEAVVELLVGMPAEKTTSTLQDLEAGRSFETDALTGVVVRKAVDHGLEVPTVRALDALLRVISP